MACLLSTESSSRFRDPVVRAGSCRAGGSGAAVFSHSSPFSTGETHQAAAGFHALVYLGHCFKNLTNTSSF